MGTSRHDRATKEASATLHRLLEHRRSTLGLGPQERVEPEQFFPVDTRLVVQLLGWTLEQVSMVGHTASGDPLVAKCVRAEKKIILLNSLTDDVKRFTLAHELGHACLHADAPDCNGGSLPRMLSMLSASKRNRGVEYSEIEREAEVYARELVMPDRAVRRHFRQLFGYDQLRAASAAAAKIAPRAHQRRPVNLHSAADEMAKWSHSSVSSMAGFFGVSPRAMAGRLIGLHLVF